MAQCDVCHPSISSTSHRRLPQDRLPHPSPTSSCHGDLSHRTVIESGHVDICHGPFFLRPRPPDLVCFAIWMHVQEHRLYTNLHPCSLYSFALCRFRFTLCSLSFLIPILFPRFLIPILALPVVFVLRLVVCGFLGWLYDIFLTLRCSKSAFSLCLLATSLITSMRFCVPSHHSNSNVCIQPLSITLAIVLLIQDLSIPAYLKSYRMQDHARRVSH